LLILTNKPILLFLDEEKRISPGLVVFYKIYKMNIEVAKKAGHYQVVKEELGQHSLGSLAGEAKPLVQTTNGAMTIGISDNDAFYSYFLDNTKNLLSDSSFSSKIRDLEFSYLGHFMEGPTPLMKQLDSLRNFSSTLSVFVGNEETPRLPLPLDPIKSQQFLTSISSLDLPSLCLSFGAKADVDKRDYPAYLRFNDRLTVFLRIFKPSLQRIDVDKKEDGDIYHLSRTLVYPDYAVDESYESTGIKKLMILFAYLDVADKGGIVLIDELDANLSGVYLSKLVEYMSLYGRGQLLFTAHALDPMYYLRKFGKSIYFLGENNVMVPWTKNAHYQPYLLYPEGLIEGSPFNLESFDFLSAFGEDK
jgi:hypothetical protein